MVQKKVNLDDKSQTAMEIKNLVKHFKGDLKYFYVQGGSGNYKRLSDISLKSFFSFVKRLPYRRDTAPVEVVARPLYILKNYKLGIDCKKKTILVTSYLDLNNIPYRFIGSSRRVDKKIHHIFPQALIDNQWKNVDATYDDYELFEPKYVTSYEVL